METKSSIKACRCLLLLMSAVAHVVFACQKGWFGIGCIYKCRCVECDGFGECRGPNKECQKHWFGPKCQYRDLGEQADPVHTQKWIVDGNDSTCNESPSVTLAQIFFRPLVPFSWLRMIVNHPATTELQDLEVIFANQKKDTLPCHQMTKSVGGDNAVDVHCSLDTAFTQITITGTLVKDLCSVYISMGRNVAVKQYARTSRQTQQEHLFVDSYLFTKSFTTCSTAFNAPGRPAVDIRLSRPSVIHHIFLHSVKGEEETFVDFIVEGFIGEKKVFSKGNAKTIFRAFHILRFNPNPVDQIQIFIPDSKEEFLLCEVELYGDTICPRGTYGLDCEQTCPCAKEFTNCLVTTGYCPEPCSPGFYGMDCDLKCPEFCFRCHRETGQCIYCPPGFYGEKCDEGCSVGYFGINCGKHCPAQCASDNCDPKSGECFQCAEGYYKAPCQLACGFSFNCTERCSERCRDRKCDTITGACDRCYEGYEGEYCSHEISGARELVTIYILSFITGASILGCLCYILYSPIPRRMSTRPFLQIKQEIDRGAYWEERPEESQLKSSSLVSTTTIY